MKRLLILLCIAGLLAAIPLSHSALAKPTGEKVKPVKVKVCHITELVLGEEFPDGIDRLMGHVIDVSENAVPAHIDHGDHLIPSQNLDKEPGDPCGRKVPVPVPE